MKPVNNELKEGQWRCDICYRKYGANDMKLGNTPLRRRMERLVEFVPEHVCSTCIQALKLKKTTSPGYHIFRAIAAKRRIKQSGDISNAANIDYDLRLLKTAMGQQISGLLGEIQKLTNLLNSATRAQSGLSHALGEYLWNSYPEMRKRANYEISKKELRYMIFSRDAWMCQKCSRRSRLTVDHIIPVIAGGGNEPENLRTLCFPCNTSKGSKIEIEVDE